jgi:uncharacterized lipoprotein YmbA
MKILLIFTILLITACSSKNTNYNNYDLEDYPDIPTMDGQKIEKYKIENKFEKVYFEEYFKKA